MVEDSFNWYHSLITSSYYAIRVNNGGHATLNNSNISFGLYGMYASGSRFISGSGGNIDARNRVRQSWSVVVDVLNRGLGVTS